MKTCSTFLRIPSISALPEHAADVRRAAEFVRDWLARAGFEGARLIEDSDSSKAAQAIRWSTPIAGTRRANPRCCSIRPLRRPAARSARGMDLAAV